MPSRPEPLIFEYSRDGRCASTHWPRAPSSEPCVPASLARREPARLPEVSELDVVRHFTRLSQLNFCIDTHFYPLGSCTMKYNPKACHAYATLAPFLARHPLAPAASGQGLLACLYELQEMLKAVTGMQALALSPMAGAQAEFAGVAMMLAHHRTRGDLERREILVPAAAHGTNPATASLCGASVREIPADRQGDIDLAALTAAVGPRTAGIMLTNPSTLGLFERRVVEVARIVHEAGALLYYDGANLNAILGKVRPAEMGFDAIHVNLHKTFSTPHGGGGPGAAAVGVGRVLEPYLPGPTVGEADGRYRWVSQRERPQSIGRLSAFMGNVGVLLRAYVYLRLLGRDGLLRVAEHATLNANYLLARLVELGFEAAYPARRAGHEVLVTLERSARENEVSAMDFAKRLLDYGVHAPTAYFPLLVPECLLIEPTETESKASLDAFAEAMASIEREAREDPERVRGAPHTLATRRLDDVRAAKHPDLTWTPGS